MPNHRFAFRPRARLVAVLGEHLISDQAVGLIELVKNSYDADATEVIIQLDHLGSADDTTVIVEDNGCGMTLDDITTKWLSPAVDHKDRAKRASSRTALGRLPLGEKGVGRFAVHQIGRTFEMVTRARGQPEIAISVDWDHFDQSDLFLDGMPLDVIERESAEVFVGEATGTRLTVRRARAQWSEKLVRKVYQTLRRLQSPLREDDSRFRVCLSCPEYPDYERIDSTDVLEKAHYEFRALVDADGTCDYEYLCKHPAVPRRQRIGSDNLGQKAREDLRAETPSCGPFYLNLYVWDRSSNHMQTSGVSRDELNTLCGVSLFRDHMRVLPYGEPGNDWLFLDQERINDPTERIANNQVIGLVQIDQAQNLRLQDKTNREGLIENDAFLDLRALVRAGLRVFTAFWRSDRPRKERPAPPVGGSIREARTVAVAIRETASADIQVSIPANAGLPRPAAGQIVPAVVPQESAVPPPDAVPSVEVVTQPQAIDRLLLNLDGAEATIEDRERRLEMMLHLAATGLAAERVVHEFGRQVRAAFDALSEVRPLVRPADRQGPALSALEAALQTLRNEFRVLAPYESVDRAQRSRVIGVRELADLALTLNRASLTEAGISTRTEGDDFRVRVRPASLVQVLDNLIHNACNWVGTLPAGRDRCVGIILAPADHRILVADTGPGVDEEAARHVFDPFFTMRAGGKGLGLYISAELMRNLGGRIRLAGPEDRHLVPAWAIGAVFVAEFDARVRVADREEGEHGA